jgi:hypothetical protein
MQNTTSLQQQKDNMRTYEDQLREQFDRLIKEHQARADSALAIIATKTTKNAEEIVNYELERQALVMQKLASYEQHIQNRGFLFFYF